MKIQTSKILPALFLLCVFSAKAQQFLNGSFELVDIECKLTLSNGGFNAHVDYTKSIGNFEFGGGIGLLTEECGTGPAADGLYYVSIGIDANYRIRSIISLEMSSPMQVGKAYMVDFYLKGANLGGLNNTLDVGLSDANTIGQFGEKVFSRKGSTNNWELVSFQFIAPIEGKYLTLKLFTGNGGRVFLDNFSIRCPTSLELGPDTSYCVVENILLEPVGSYESFRWQDQSTEAGYLVQEPGIYWVEAMRDECVLRDSIIISEIEHNCQCQFFVPNVFSPNLDGINDLIRPLTDCELSAYEFQVFSRWGQLLYQSTDAREGWNGQVNNRLMPNGAYVYQLKYQFSYEESPRYQGGDFVLLR